MLTHTSSEQLNFMLKLNAIYIQIPWQVQVMALKLDEKR
jgi:hypothetical protein